MFPDNNSDHYEDFRVSLVAQMVKTPICNAADLDLIPDWEDSLEKGMAIRSSILAWKIP